MNKRDIRVVREAAKRFMADLAVYEVQDIASALKIEIPNSTPLYFFIIKRAKDGRFSLIIPVESAGLIAVDSTLTRLQPLLKSYNLILSSDRVIMEENIKIPLHERIGIMVRALIALDGVRRLWQVEADRRSDAESKVIESAGNGTNNRPSR